MTPRDPLPRRVERTIRQLATLDHLAPLPHALAVGRIVTQELLDGDPAAHRRRAWAAAALRRLARDPRLPISESSLYRGVGVYEVACRHDPLDPGLRLGHLRAVLGLTPAVQDRLLAAAVRDGLRARDLEAIVHAHRRRGQRAEDVQTPLRALRRLARALDELEPALVRRRAQLRTILTKIRDRADRLIQEPEG